MLDDLEPERQVERARFERQGLARADLDNLGVAELAHVGANDCEPVGDEGFGEADEAATHVERGEGTATVIEQRLGQPGEQPVALIDIRLVSQPGVEAFGQRRNPSTIPSRHHWPP